MIPMTLAEVAAAVDGTLHGVPDKDLLVSGPVEYDSRAVRPGGLFVAFAGAKVDGHDFAAAALAAGAVAVLGSRPVAAPTIVVADPLVALGKLARAVVDRLPELTIVGITGSSGKTTTKDQIGQVLARHGATVAPAGSFNNELGLPHTVLKADADTRYLVLEMGARGIGHIGYLCGIAPPRVGVVTNVGDAHIGEFGSVEAIARAKGELVEALPAAPRGVAVLNVDDERVRAMAARTAARVAFVGQDGQADVRAVDVRLDARGRASYTLVAGDASAAVTLPVPGAHQVANTLAAAAVGLAVGMDLAMVAAALTDLRSVSSRRMDVFDRADGVTVIDDSYNANPSSTAAALRALTTVGDGRRRIAVLGFMAELGDHERAGHEGVGRLAAELGVDLLVAVGSAGAIHDGALTVAQWGGKSVHVTDQVQAVALLRGELKPGDVVLVKGSRYRTWDIADALREVSA